jgi:hypothetical protein
MHGEYKDHKRNNLKSSGKTIGRESIADTNEAFKHVQR